MATRILGARVQFEMNAPVLLLRIGGPITQALMRAIRDQLLDETVLRSTRAAVVDVRRGILIADPLALVSNRAARGMGLTSNLPAAIVASEQESSVYRRYAVAAAFAGYIRRVFTCEVAALAWALQEASLPPW